MSKNIIKQKIFTAIRDIPYGSVCAYGQVAARAGLPGRARLVAKLLSESEDEGLPWHRVVRASGQIAFPEDSPLFAEQQQRLRSEGHVLNKDRVKMPKIRIDLDALLWAPK